MVAPPTLEAVDRVIVTGAGTWLGGRFIQELERRGDVEVFGFDEVEPAVPFASRFHQTRIDTISFAERAVRLRPNRIVHLQTVDRTATLGPVRTREAIVMGTQILIGVTARLGTVRHLLVASDVTAHGSGPRQPSVVGCEADPAPTLTRYEQSLNDLERQVSGAAVPWSVIRLAPVIGHLIRNPLSRYLLLPVVPTLLGFDPRLQVLCEDDAVAALVHAFDVEPTGFFDIAAEGEMYLSRMLRIGRRVPYPLLARQFARAASTLQFGGPGLPEHLVRTLRFGRVVDAAPCIERLGFRPECTVRSVVTNLYGRS